jgi:hypothetical protein
MKSNILLLMIAALLSGCQSQHQSHTDLAILRPVAGNYYRGNGTGYNINLDLRPDGSYDANWRGCLGVYGTARGHWTVDGEHVLLTPTKETDMMRGHLKRLDFATHEGRLILLPSNDREFYDKHGASRFSCFQRTEVLK